MRGDESHSVLDFWQARVAGQPLTAYRRVGASTADLFALAVDGFRQRLTAPVGLALDNASIHKTHVVRARHADQATC